MPAATVISILAITLIASAVVLWRMPVATCSRCLHCQAEALAREQEAEDRAARFYGIPKCPGCGRRHSSEEPHRR